MPYFKADGSPLEHDLIVVTMKAWVGVPMLSTPELSLIEHLRDAAVEGPEPFEAFVKSIPSSFVPLLWTAILKARAVGVGQYADTNPV